MSPEVHTLKWKRSRGINQIELIIVVVVIATFLGVASLSFHRAISNAGLRHLSDKIMADLEYARLQSRREQKEYRVRFRPESQKYDVLDSSETTLWTIAIDEGDYHADEMVVNLKNDNTVVFDRYGQSDEYGTIELRANDDSLMIEICQSGMIRQI